MNPVDRHEAEADDESRDKAAETRGPRAFDPAFVPLSEKVQMFQQM